MEDLEKKASVRSPFQHRLSLFLLVSLVLIGGTILWIQGRYDPAAWQEQHASTPSQAPAQADLPEGLTPLSPPEQYNASNLSDKINGKADLYLNAGFTALHSQRFALASDNNRWMERYVYDMADPKNAFAVYSAQRRRDVQTVELASQAYLSSNGLFLVHGPYYVEIIASEMSDAMQTQMKALASVFVKSHAVQSFDLPELDLFDGDQLVPNTLKLIADSAFGIQNLDGIFTGNYAADKDEATVFVSKRASADEAGSMADQFIAYWNEYGAETVQPPETLKGARIAFILDAYEISMVKGPYFFGVHEASRLEFGLQLITRLQRSIEDFDKEAAK